MKKIIPLYVLLIISLVSCKEKPDGRSSSQSNLKDDTQGLRDSLIGKWGGLEESSPVWDIGKDSIYYFGRSTAYPYKIIDHDFIIYFPDHIGGLLNIRIEHDTMFFFLRGNPLLTKAYRFKK